MDLYSLHANPEKLDGYERRFEIPLFAYDYGKSNGFTDEVISLIAKDPDSAVEYAERVLKKPWHESDVDPGIARQAEQTIAKGTGTVPLSYARYVLDKPWHEAEGIDPKIARKAELSIATNALSAFQYAYYVLGKAWRKAPGIDSDLARQAEQTIAKDAGTASMLYAYNFGIKL